jgi:biopolymer transport protein ExbB
MIELFLKGGPIMWPILVASVVALSVALERMFFALGESSRRNPQQVRDILLWIERGDVAAARKIGVNSRDFVARALVQALAHPTKFQEAMLAAASVELRRYSRGLPILDTIITLAPLLGLLGTVTGMISSFGMLGGAELGAPSAITGGIAEALLATAFGLGVAITALLPFNFMNAREEEARLALQDAASKAELHLKL